MKKFYNRNENIIEDFFKKDKQEKKREKQKTWLKKNRYRKNITRQNGK